MAFSNYYLANDLSGLGQQMQQDRGLQVQAQMAQAEQKRLAYAQFMQQLQAQQAQAQQAQQFQQELAMRQQGQSQENAYREALLGLRRSDSASDDKYRYAALENAVKQIQEQARLQSPQAAAARISADEKTKLDMAQALDMWEKDKVFSTSKASKWTSRVNQTKRDIAEEQKEKSGEWLTSKGGAETWAKSELRKRLAAIPSLIDQDTATPGSIEQVDLEDIGKGFRPVISPRPYSDTGQPYNPLTDVGPGGQVPVGSVGIPQGRDVPIKVRTSDGKPWDAMSSQWPQIQKADPGAVLITPNRHGPQVGGAGGGWEPARKPQRTGLWNALYGNAKDFYGGAYNNAIDFYGEAAQPVVTQSMDYYQQLMDMLNQRNPPQ